MPSSLRAVSELCTHTCKVARTFTFSHSPQTLITNFHSRRMLPRDLPAFGVFSELSEAFLISSFKTRTTKPVSWCFFILQVC